MKSRLKVRTVLVGLASFAVLCTVISSNAHAITYGSTVSDPLNTAPWVVSIWNSPTNDILDAEPICTGTLISPHTVLTAAHCILEPGSFFVKVKSQALRDSTPLTTVSGIWSNPRYDLKTYTNDIGLLKLDDDFPGIAYPSLANTQAAKSINSKTNFTLYGWGRDQAGSMADLLRSAKLGLQDTLAAKVYKNSKTKFNQTTMISAGRKIAAENVWSGACEGDSGGPLIVSINQINVVAGVTGWGERSCSAPTPTVFARVSYYNSDIKNGLKAVELQSTVVNRTAPVPISNPQISGTPIPGNLITCDPGLWKNAVSTVTTWTSPKRVVGLQTQSVKISPTDSGQLFSCTIIVSTQSGTIVRKVLKKLIPSAPTLTSKPSITGADLSSPAAPGTMLRCDGWNWDSPVESESIQWFLTSQSNPQIPINGELVGTGTNLILDEKIVTKLANRFVTCDVTGTKDNFSTDGISTIRLNPLNGPTLASVAVSGLNMAIGGLITCSYKASDDVKKAEITWGLSSDGVNFTPFKNQNGNVLQIDKTIVSIAAGKLAACQVKVTNAAGEASRIGLSMIPFISPPALPTVSIHLSGNISATSTLLCSGKPGAGYTGQLDYKWGVTTSANSTELLGSPLGNSNSLSLNPVMLRQSAGYFISCLVTASNDAGSTSSAASISVPYSVIPLPVPATPLISIEKAEVDSITEVIAVPYFSGFDPVKMNLSLQINGKSNDCLSPVRLSTVPTTVTCHGLTATTTYYASLALSYIDPTLTGSTNSQQLVFTTPKLAFPTVPPIILNYSQAFTGNPPISPSSGTAASLSGSGVDIRFVAQDSSVPVTAARVQLVSLAGQIVSSAQATFLGGDSKNGAWLGNLQIPASLAPGSYAVQASATDGINMSNWTGLGNLTIDSQSLPTLMNPQIHSATTNSVNLFLPSKPSGWNSGWQLIGQIFSSNQLNLLGSTTALGTYLEGSVLQVMGTGSSGLIADTSYSVRWAVYEISSNRYSYSSFTNFKTAATIPMVSDLGILPAPASNGINYSNQIVLSSPGISSIVGYSPSFTWAIKVYSEVGTLISTIPVNSGNQISITGLSGGTAYQIYLVATDSVGNSKISQPLLISTLPTNPSVTTLGAIQSPSTPGINYPTQIVLNSPNLTAIIGYSSSFTWTIRTTTSSGILISTLPANTGNQIFITGLSPVTTYYVSIVATDSYGASVASPPLILTTAQLSDTTSPTVVPGSVSVTPTSLYENGSITVSTLVSDDFGVNQVLVRLRQSSGLGGIGLSTGLFSLSKSAGSSNSGTWTGTSSMNFNYGSSDGYLLPGVYDAIFSATDGAGNVGTYTKTAAFILGAQAGNANIALASVSSNPIYAGSTIQISARIIAYNQTISAVRVSGVLNGTSISGFLSEVSGNAYDKNYLGDIALPASIPQGAYSLNLVAETANGRVSAIYTLTFSVAAPLPVSQASVTQTYFTTSLQNRCPSCTTVHPGYNGIYWEVWTMNASSIRITATNGSDVLTSPEETHGGIIQQSFDYGNGVKKWWGYIQLWPAAPLGTYAATWIVTDSNGLSAQYPAGTFFVTP